MRTLLFWLSGTLLFSAFMLTAFEAEISARLDRHDWLRAARRPYRMLYRLSWPVLGLGFIAIVSALATLYPLGVAAALSLFVLLWLMFRFHELGMKYYGLWTRQRELRDDDAAHTASLLASGRSPDELGEVWLPSLGPRASMPRWMKRVGFLDQHYESLRMLRLTTKDGLRLVPRARLRWNLLAPAAGVVAAVSTIVRTWVLG